MKGKAESILFLHKTVVVYRVSHYICRTRIEDSLQVWRSWALAKSWSRSNTEMTYCTWAIIINGMFKKKKKKSSKKSIWYNLVSFQLPSICFILLVVLCVAKNTWKVSNPLQCSKAQDQSIKCTVPRQHRIGCFIFHIQIQFQHWKIQAVQISMKLHISTCIFLLLSKELGQTFVSPVNTTWAAWLPPCDVLHMKTLQCSFGNSIQKSYSAVLGTAVFKVHPFTTVEEQDGK